MDALEVVFMGLISVQTIGTSTEGRPLRLLKIATNDGVDKPAIFIDGTFHAREFISPATVESIFFQICRFALAYPNSKRNTLR